MAELMHVMHDEKLMQCVEEVERGGQTLRQALLSRDAGQVWDAVELQERSLRELQRLESVLRERSAADDGTDSARVSPPAAVRELVERTQAVLRSNRALARAFLDIIDRTLSQFAGAVGRDAMVYGATGQMDRPSQPLLVQQKG